MTATTEYKFSDIVVLVNADYADSVAQRLRHDFEKMLQRPIQKADMVSFCEGLLLQTLQKRPENAQVEVFLMHQKEKNELKHFVPSDLNEKLNGKAVKENDTEYAFYCLPIEASIANDTIMQEMVNTIVMANTTSQIIVVGDIEYAPTQKENITLPHITIYNMQDEEIEDTSHGILGFPLMPALNVRQEEFK